jgi:epoxyqueuosine reductase QueG
MPIKDALSGISRRTLLGGGGAIVAAAVAVPGIITITHKVEEQNARKRIAQFLNDFLEKAYVSVWNQHRSTRRPEGHRANSLRDAQVNTAGELDNVRLFDSPAVGFASSHDPFFTQLRNTGVVGPNHFLPEQLLPGAKTVISYFYPFTEEIRASNRPADGVPSVKQVAGKGCGDFYLETVGRALTQFIEGMGYAAVVPTLDQRYQSAADHPLGAPSDPNRQALQQGPGHDQDHHAHQDGPGHDQAIHAHQDGAGHVQGQHAHQDGPGHDQNARARQEGGAGAGQNRLASQLSSHPAWSERHVAFIAGVGTFGLHRSLITEKGSSGRIGSVVTTLDLTPTIRPYGNDIHGYCPFYLDGSCVACIDRCPGKAVSKEDNNQATRCSKYVRDFVEPKFDPVAYHGDCSKCLTAVPCEKTIPASMRRRS